MASKTFGAPRSYKVQVSLLHYTVGRATLGNLAWIQIVCFFAVIFQIRVSWSSYLGASSWPSASTKLRRPLNFSHLLRTRLPKAHNTTLTPRKGFPYRNDDIREITRLLHLRGAANLFSPRTRRPNSR